MAPKPDHRQRRQKSIGRHRSGSQAEQGVVGGKSSGSQARHRPDPRIDKAQLAWEQGRFDEAIWFYERALARDPKNAVLLTDVARAYALRYRYCDAERLIGLAEKLYPEDANLQQMLGRSFVMLQQFDRAIGCYRRFLELSPSAPERPFVLVELAKMYERLHELGAARRSAEEALALAPDFEQAAYVLANICRREGNAVEASDRWRNLIDSKDSSPGIKADSWYQLAALYDKTGRYDESFDALTHAKQIFDQASAPVQYDATRIARGSGKTILSTTADHFWRWSSECDQLKRLDGGLALLTSHPRSGTTLLEQVLDSHPGAISADELQVMSDLVYLRIAQKAPANASVVETLDNLPLDEIDGLRQAYWAGMEGALRQPIGDRMLLDKNPELTMLLPLVARVFPDMRIVFALRDPRDVVVSCFTQQLPLNPVSVHYLTLEGTAKKYAATMRSWIKLRDMLKNPWIEVRYEDSVADLESQARRVLDFLGLPWDTSVLKYHERAQQKHVHSPTYEAVTKPIYSSSIGRWRNYARQLEPFLGILQPFVDAFGYD